MIKKHKTTSTIPKREIEALAKCFLPYIREFYESEEGKKAFEEWERAKANGSVSTSAG